MPATAACRRSFIHALSENTAMLKIARNAGATVERDGPESEAWLRLPPDTFVVARRAVMGEQAAEFDYQLKRHASRVQQILEAISEVKTHMSKAAPHRRRVAVGRPAPAGPARPEVGDHGQTPHNRNIRYIERSRATCVSGS